VRCRFGEVPPQKHRRAWLAPQLALARGVGVHLKRDVKELSRLNRLSEEEEEEERLHELNKNITRMHIPEIQFIR